MLKIKMIEIILIWMYLGNTSNMVDLNVCEKMLVMDRYINDIFK